MTKKTEMTAHNEDDHTKVDDDHPDEDSAIEMLTYPVGLHRE